MSIPCEWCKSTSETIDSLEYQVEQLESQLKALKGEGWISVERRENLPEEVGYYLIYYRDTDGWERMAMAFYNSSEDWCGHDFYYANVKYYMPLPSSPQVKGEE